MNVLTVGSLFSGIGGFDLGLERAGMQVVWQCEQGDFCRRVLRRHWPTVPCYPDVRELKGAEIEPVDVLAAGWPCPGFSVAGRGEGFDHEGSGLWSEVVRLTSELRPRYLLLENVSALLRRGFERVLGELAACGYDAEWDCIPASAIGAPHRRDRIWIVAYPGCERSPMGGRSGNVACPAGAGEAEGAERERDGDAVNDCRADVADPARVGSGHGRMDDVQAHALAEGGEARALPPAGSVRGRSGGWSSAWPSEPPVGRVADGVPDQLDRLRSLGNALVPQIAEWIGRRIVAYEEGRLAA